MLLVGATRSGKSAMTYALLCQAASDPTVLVAGVDVSSILLSPFATEATKPWVHLGSANLEHAVEVVENMVSEMQRRLDFLIASGLDKVNPGVDFPIVLFVLEEYPGLLGALDGWDAASGVKAADRLKPRLLLGVGRLLRESAKVGIRVLTISQTAHKEILGGDLRSQYSRRWCHRLDSAGDVSLCLESATKEQVEGLMTSQPGVSLYWEAGHPIVSARSHFIEYPAYRDFVVRRMASKRTPYPPTTTTKEGSQDDASE